ncbi:hypothetical protein [Amycolatopsis magusensis]|uniref:hypothetical protein n=1 Tax=Amycolatopsis magusensis TaxID=882444 RepID=UPI003C2FCC24
MADTWKHWCPDRGAWHDGERADCEAEECQPARERGAPDEWHNGQLVAEYQDTSGAAGTRPDREPGGES